MMPVEISLLPYTAMGLFDKLLNTKPTNPQAANATAPGTPQAATPASGAPSTPPATPMTSAPTSGGLPPLGTPTASASPTMSDAAASTSGPNAFQQADSLLGLTPPGAAPSASDTPAPSTDAGAMTPTDMGAKNEPASPLVPPVADSSKDTGSSMGATMPAAEATSAVKVDESPALDAGMSNPMSAGANMDQAKQLVSELESKLEELKKALG